MTKTQRRTILGTSILGVFLLAITFSIRNSNIRDQALEKAGAQEFMPWPVWETMWHLTASCLDVPEKPIALTKWIELASTQPIPRIFNAPENSRVMWLKPDSLVFMAGAMADSALVLHELTHLALGKDGHPTKYFDGRCGVLPRLDGEY